jgi:hypothetical protein
VGTQPFWNWTHEAWWHTPNIDDMVDALEKAHAEAGGIRHAAREFAEQFDTERVWPLWKTVIDGYAAPA